MLCFLAESKHRNALCLAVSEQEDVLCVAGSEQGHDLFCDRK